MDGDRHLGIAGIQTFGRRFNGCGVGSNWDRIGGRSGVDRDIHRTRDVGFVALARPGRAHEEQVEKQNKGGCRYDDQHGAKPLFDHDASM